MVPWVYAMIARKPKRGGIRLIIGLGNPGKEYSNTYHNAGGIFTDYLARTLGGVFKKTRDFEYARLDKLILAKPFTYMNESGTAVYAAMKYFKLAPADVLVAHDDSDLALGKFKLSVGQRPAGHHGIESVVNVLDSNDFARLRIGVRPPVEKKRKKAGDFVLKPITPIDKEVLESVFQDIVAEIRDSS